MLTSISAFAQMDSVNNSRTMLGTYYSNRFVGRHTSGGDIFRQNQYTAAHKTYAFGTYLLVTYPKTGNSVVVKVNDRCPKSNVLDMTKIALQVLGFKGSAKVTVSVLEPTMGQMMWLQQDTSFMTKEDYLAYGDKHKHHKVSPYPLGPGQTDTDDVAVASTNTRPVRPAKPKSAKKTEKKDFADSTKSTNSTDTVVIEPTMPTTDSVVISNRPKGPAYDLELETVGSRAIALLELQRLPKQYSSKVTLDTNPTTKEVRIILSLGDSRSHVVRVQAELTDLFPDSIVISHKNK